MRIVIAAVFLLQSVFAQVQDFGHAGQIDWEHRTVVAKGIGVPNPNMPAVTARPMAIQAARSDALRNALELVKGIQVTSTTTVENFMVSSDVIRKEVSGYIRTFTESEPRYMDDKSIEITVTIPVDNQLAQAVLPENTGNANGGPVAKSPEMVASSAGFSGLIIDARGLGVIPALAPKIYDEDGKEVYGSAYVSREFAIKWGMAGYAKTPEQASLSKDRVGATPGVVKALKATGASKCDLVLSRKDAQSVQDAAKSMSFLSDCRVIIVVD